MEALVVKEDIIVIGAGGHAKVAIDVLLSDDLFNIKGIIDKTVVGQILGIPVVGDDSHLDSIYRSGIKKVFVAIGDSDIRKRLFETVKSIGFEIINVISKKAYIAASVKLMSGICVYGGAVINADAEIADGVIINTNAVIEHDAVIGHFCHIAPGAVICGGVEIGDKTLIGAGATVINNISIGCGCIIGAGAVVVNDVHCNNKVMGVPAKKRMISE